MRLYEVLIAGIAGFFSLIIFLCGCSNINQQKVLYSLPEPVISLHSSSKGLDSDKLYKHDGNEGKKNSGKKTFFPAYSSFLPVVPAEWIPFKNNHKWDAIIIHHSATEVGGAKRFDKMHRMRGWDELGYHFVIGNGTDTPDGFVEVGSRWKKQKHGAHCRTPSNHFNEYGIGICLVGNFEYQYPSPYQLQSLRKLVVYLATKYNIPASRVLGHREVPGTHTKCPGKHMPMELIRSWVRNHTEVWAAAK